MANLISTNKYALYFKKVSLMYQQPEIKASLEVILSVLTVTLLIFAAIRPTLVNVASLQKKITDQEATNKKADNKMAQLFNAQKQLTTYAGEIGLFDEAVPDGFSYKDMIGRIGYVAIKNGLTIDSLSFQGFPVLSDNKLKTDWSAKLVKIDANNLIPTLVNFSVTGKPQGVIAFIKEVENVDRLGVIKSINLTKTGALKNAPEFLKADGQIEFYFYSQKQ